MGELSVIALLRARFQDIAIGIFLCGVVCFVVACVIACVIAFRTFPVRHAKASLTTITELAETVASRTIPERRYLDAIDAADYIESYYPARRRDAVGPSVCR